MHLLFVRPSHISCYHPAFSGGFFHARKTSCCCPYSQKRDKLLFHADVVGFFPSLHLMSLSLFPLNKYRPAGSHHITCTRMNREVIFAKWLCRSISSQPFFSHARRHITRPFSVGRVLVLVGRLSDIKNDGNAQKKLGKSHALMSSHVQARWTRQRRADGGWTAYILTLHSVRFGLVTAAVGKWKWNPGWK